MQGTPSFPHAVLPDSWVGLILWALLAGAGWIKVFLDRRRPPEINASTAKTLAEAVKGHADAGAVVAGFVGSLSAKITELNTELEEQRERHAKEIESARTRVHNAIGEVDRCIGFIKHHEILMTEHKIEFTPFMVKSYRDIMGEE
jgi:hypothetical protein